MQKLIVFFLFFSISHSAFTQYYIRGEIRDQFDKTVQNVKITIASTGVIYYSGTKGGFGISSKHLYDTLFLSKEGYTPFNIVVKTDEFQNLILKLSPASLSILKPKLVSLSTHKDENFYTNIPESGETYSTLIENDFVKTGDETKTTFSLRIDKASYSNIRRMINQEMKVPPDAVRIDEMLNYFNFNYQEPENDDVFKIESQLTDCPWNKTHQLLIINLSAKKIKLDHVPPSNLVFLIDVSASMDQPNRLPLIKEAFQLLVKNLRKIDTVSIIAYGNNVRLSLLPTSGENKEKINAAIESLNAFGDTPGEDALKTAYLIARKTFILNGNNRIILATDGDFNVGLSSEKKLEELIGNEKQNGISLTCLGVGMGNYKDSKIEILSKKGDGNFAYLDSIQEAEKVFVTEFTQTLYSVARNVQLSIRFDSTQINQYRLIGFDNKRASIEEKSNELEGGEIGSGSGNTIIFEIIPNTKSSNNSAIATVSVEFNLPQDTSQYEMKYKCSSNYVEFKELKKSLQLATAIAMFGLKLRESKFFPPIKWEVIKNIAAAAIDTNNYLENQFLELIGKSKNFNEKKKKKNWLW